jgi:hypothetical protein
VIAPTKPRASLTHPTLRQRTLATLRAYGVHVVVALDKPDRRELGRQSI